MNGVSKEPPKTGWLEATFTATTEPRPATSPAGDSQDGLHNAASVDSGSGTWWLGALSHMQALELILGTCSGQTRSDNWRGEVGGQAVRVGTAGLSVPLTGETEWSARSQSLSPGETPGPPTPSLKDRPGSFPLPSSASDQPIISSCLT